MILMPFIWKDDRFFSFSCVTVLHFISLAIAEIINVTAALNKLASSKMRKLKS